MGWRDGVKTHYRGGPQRGAGGTRRKVGVGDGQWVLIHTEKNKVKDLIFKNLGLLPVFFNKMQVPIYSSEQKLSFLKQKHPKCTGRIFTFLKVFQ